MTRRAGSADLPLHGGRVPAWLAERMAILGSIVCEAIVLQYGRDELLRRLAHPFWFQSFGAVMGMDWHSSGMTTSVVGALRRGLGPRADELGLHICGGRGRHSRKTPTQLLEVGDRVGLDGDALARTSKLVAKVDSAAVQDGYQLYLHAFIVADDGAWTVVQQGMNDRNGYARRYHWLSEGLESFVDSPHQAIEGEQHAVPITNLTDLRARPSRQHQLELVEQGPDRVLGALRKLRPAPEPATELLPHLSMPAHHEVRESDVVMRRLRGSLAAAADAGPRDFSELLLTKGVGARTVEALAMVAEVVHGAPHRFSDPARFAMAHGGKDGHPFPVPLKVYDETIGVLRDAVERAKLGQQERASAMERLDTQARLLEAGVDGPTFQQYIRRERERSHRYGGRTVFGKAQPPTSPKRPRPRRGPQLSLPGMSEPES